MFELSVQKFMEFQSQKTFTLLLFVLAGISVKNMLRLLNSLYDKLKKKTFFKKHFIV